MNEYQNNKVVGVIDPSSDKVDDADFTTNEVDTLGFNYAQFYIYFGTMDIAMAALHIGESDTSGSTGTIIANTNFASTAGITAIDGSTLVLPSGTQDTNLYRIDVDCTGPRKRYLDLLATAGDGSAGNYAVAFCILSAANEAPITEAAQGCVQVARA